MEKSQAKRLSTGLLIVTVWLILGGCTTIIPTLEDEVAPATFALTVTNSPAPSPSSTTLPASLTPSPSPTALPPSPTPTQGPTPTAVPPPPLPASVESDFFLGGNSPECQLPCWNGLVIGESGQEEIQAVFDDVFGFDGTFDLFSPPRADYLPSHLPDGLDAVGYWWGSDSIGGIFLFLVVEEDSHMLRGMEFFWETSSEFEPQASLRSILRELGTPSRLLMRLGPPQAFVATYDILALYEERGVTFFLRGGFPVDTATNPDGSERMSVVEVCLGEVLFHGRAYISEPLRNGLRDLSPLQAYWLSWIPNDRYLDPSEEVLGLTAEEITALAMQDEDVCITIEFEGY